MTPAQCKEARTLLGWSRDRLEEATGIAIRTITRIEAGESAPRASTAATIRTALEAAGVEFIAENGGGLGVRLRTSDG